MIEDPRVTLDPRAPRDPRVNRDRQDSAAPPDHRAKRDLLDRKEDRESRESASCRSSRMRVVPNNASDSENKVVTVRCEWGGEDLFAIGGGYILGGSTANVNVTVSRPDGLAGEVPAGWRVEAVETGAGQSGSWSITAYAACANVK